MEPIVTLTMNPAIDTRIRCPTSSRTTSWLLGSR